MRLFRLAGISVFLHWSWFIVAAIEIGSRSRIYSSQVWNLLEYLALFLIVLIHEFGHAFACRQVGGTANQIVLWPLGGVAFVNPPPRPGANLWSIAAGPLVNVVLIPILWVLSAWSKSSGLAVAPNTEHFLEAISNMNLGLLFFNVLPIYPLDGGQILRSLLWFVFGRARSLTVASIIGVVGAAGFILLAIASRQPWLGIIAIFVGMLCWSGLKQAQTLSRLARLPRRGGFACPRCKSAPPVGDFWKCGQCGQPFDTFATGAVCPYCSAQFAVTSCLDCGAVSPMSEWTIAAIAPLAVDLSLPLEKT